MDRDDMLQVLLEHEEGLSAQAVRAEMRGRYGSTGPVKAVLDTLVAEGLAVVGEDEEGRRMYAPVFDKAVSAVRGRESESKTDESFFG